MTPPGRRLRVRIRPKPPLGDTDQTWSLFARLSPHTAQALLNDACATPSREFLPLCLSSKEKTIYVSYNGGSIAEDGVIELAEGTFSSESSVTFVTVMPVPDAVSVELEPLTTSDWESLEVYADWLEDGGLLQQVSVVYPNQELCLKVGGSQFVQARVLCDAPVRLLANTEVHIMSKPRTAAAAADKSLLLRVLPSWDDFSTDMQELALRMEDYHPPVHVSPCSLLVHPDTLEGLEEEGSIIVLSKVTESSVTAFARVETCKHVAEGCAVLHSLLRYQLDVSPLWDHVRVQSVGPVDSSLLLEMVADGSLHLSLEPVDFMESSAVDRDLPWRYPDGMRPRKRDAHYRSRNDVSYVSQLRTILASWVDLPDDLGGLPLGPGSLIALPWVGAESETVYRLEAHFEMDKDDSVQFNTESLCVLAKDLPYVLLKSSSAISRQSTPGTSIGGRNAVSISARDHLLNLLPPTRDLVSTESSEITSFVTSDLDSFDGIFLCGEVGSGKTHTALVLAARARLAKAYSTLYLDCKKLQSSSEVRMNGILQTLTLILREAHEAGGPCVVILDDLDELIPNVNMGSDEEEGSAHQQQPNPVAVDQAKLIADHLQNLMCTKPTGQRPKVFFVLSCRDEQSIHPSILSGRLYRNLEVPSFGPADRERLFLSMLRKKGGSELLSGRDVTFPGLGSNTEGFRPRDLDAVATRVVHVLRQDGIELSSHPCSNVVAVVDEIMRCYVPISRQGIRTEDTASSVTWSQVGGLFRVKEHLVSTIVHPVKYRRIYEEAPIRLPRGTLLFGPPGCGKSHLVPALAKECGLTLITCHGPELLDKYIGASEAKVRQLFQRALAASPSLLFLDEFDAMAPVRGSDHTGVTDRVVNQLLTYLDGVEDLSCGSVYIVAATSRPDNVDPALLRPGRLEQHVFVGYPSSREEWHNVLEQIVVRHEIDSQLREHLREQALWEVADVKRLSLFSCADLKAVSDTAYLCAVHEHLESGGDEEQDVTVTIQLRHMIKSLQSTRPSLSVDDKRMLNNIYRPYISAVDRLEEDDLETAAENPARLRTALK